MDNNKYIDTDDSVLYLVRYLDNRQFFMGGHNEKEVLHKTRNYFEANYQMNEAILDIVMSTVKVERTEVEWPMLNRTFLAKDHS